jgi:GT2 family glycosyltransferase
MPEPALATHADSGATAGKFDARPGLVIVDYQCWPDTREAIASALQSQHEFHRIVVVDNGGTVPEEDCTALSPRIALIRAKANGGFAQGVNLGLGRLKEDGATHAMLLNPDARLQPTTLQRLLEVVENDPGIAIAGPVVYHDAGLTRIEFSGAREWWHLGWLPHRTTPPRSRISFEPFITGACWLMRLSVVDDIGPLPEGYFLYFEDTDYCQTARHKGYRLAVVAEAEVVHLGSQTVQKHSPLFRYQLARNRIWFMRRWARMDQYVVFLIFTALIKAPMAALLFGLRDRDGPALWAFYTGCWHGLMRPVFSVRNPGNVDMPIALEAQRRNMEIDP